MLKTLAFLPSKTPSKFSQQVIYLIRSRLLCLQLHYCNAQSNFRFRDNFPVLIFSHFYAILHLFNLILHFFYPVKMAPVQNKIAATALGSGSRDMALVCIERPSITLHHQMQKWAPQWIILPFTSWTFQKDIKTCNLFKLKIHSSI